MSYWFCNEHQLVICLPLTCPECWKKKNLTHLKVIEEEQLADVPGGWD